MCIFDRIRLRSFLASFYDILIVCSGVSLTRELRTEPGSTLRIAIVNAFKFAIRLRREGLADLE